MTFFPVRSAAFATFFSLILLSVLVPTGSNLNAARPSGSTKVTICHRTHSVTNPYRRITVSQSSIVGGANSKHGNDTGAHNDWSVGKLGPSRPDASIANVFDPNHTYSPATDKKWGDIVPNVDVSGNPIQSNFPGLNYFDAGLAIYNGTSYNGVDYAAPTGTPPSS